MAFKLSGNGTTTSSVSFTTLNLTNTFPAIPETYITAGHNITHVTESGLQHNFMLGQRQRSWNVSLRLLSGTDMKALELVYDTLLGGWCLWEFYSGTMDAPAATYMQDTNLNTGYDNAIRNMVVVTTAGTGSGQIRRITSSSHGGGTVGYVTTWSVTPSNDTQYVLGWFVRFASPLTIEVFPPGLYNVSFTFEEQLLGTTI